MGARLIFIMCCFLLSISCDSPPISSNTNSCEYYFDNNIKKRIFTIVDTIASYPNGDVAFLSSFFENFRYPEQDVFQGRIVLELIVDEKGTIIQKGIKGKTNTQFTDVEKEALRCLHLLPRWIPAKCGNITVTSRLYYPIMF